MCADDTGGAKGRLTVKKMTYSKKPMRYHAAAGLARGPGLGAGVCVRAARPAWPLSVDMRHGRGWRCEMRVIKARARSHTHLFRSPLSHNASRIFENRFPLRQGRARAAVGRGRAQQSIKRSLYFSPLLGLRPRKHEYAVAIMEGRQGRSWAR